jgi:hypothetical protein
MGLDPQKSFAEMYEDGGVKYTVGVEVEVLDAVVPHEPLEEVLTQKVHLAPITQQAEQAGFTRAKSHETCQSIFPEKLTKDKGVRYQSLELAG